MSKHITLIRHAQSKANNGESNGPDARLSTLGVEQASKVHGHTKVLVLSNLRRTMETFINSGLKPGRMLVSELFREIKEGENGDYLEGEEVTIETPEEINKRIRQAIDYLQAIDSDEITVICHGVFIWHFMKTIGMPVNSVANCEMFKFRL